MQNEKEKKRSAWASAGRGACAGYADEVLGSVDDDARPEHPGHPWFYQYYLRAEYRRGLESARGEDDVFLHHHHRSRRWLLLVFMGDGQERDMDAAGDGAGRRRACGARRLGGVRVVGRADGARDARVLVACAPRRRRGRLGARRGVGERVVGRRGGWRGPRAARGAGRPRGGRWRPAVGNRAAGGRRRVRGDGDSGVRASRGCGGHGP